MFHKQLYNCFMNINYKYQITKNKIDLDLSWNNIFNTKHYINSFNYNYLQSKTQYNLRPSQIMISIRFNLESF